MSVEQTEASPTKPLTRIERKRQEIYLERRRRALNKGVPEAQVDAVLAREDFERLPLEERVHHMISGSVQQLAGDLAALQHNDQLLSSALDVNFRAISKMLEKLGLSKADQMAMLKASKEEIEKELLERDERLKAAEAQKATEELKDATDQAGTPAPPPDEATVFGG